VIHGIFAELGFGKFTIYINNRKLLRGLLEQHAIPADKHAAALHDIDRLRKVGRAKVQELLAAAIDPGAASALLDVLTTPWADIAGILKGDGADELRRVYDGTLALGVPADALKVDLSIVRGLDYYTGTVYETFLDAHPEFGSICSGGRYDDLASHYTKSKLPGVGISIGITRLLDQLLEAEAKAVKEKRAPELAISSMLRATAKVIVLNVDASLGLDYAKLAAELRAAGINTEVYGGTEKLGKQFKYADRAGVALAVVVGSKEREANIVNVKDLRVADDGTGANQHAVPRGELVAHVRALLA
jgi:histidyl-tRNA synthetase